MLYHISRIKFINIKNSFPRVKDTVANGVFVINEGY